MFLEETLGSVEHIHEKNILCLIQLYWNQLDTTLRKYDTKRHIITTMGGDSTKRIKKNAIACITRI